jgi:anti-sigma B factor antagonist
MVISSRTPEGRPNHCPVCGFHLSIEPSDPAGDAPCPRCGHLLWFTWDDLGDVRVIRPTGSQLDLESLDGLIDAVAMRPSTRLVIDFSEVSYLASPILARLINLKKRLGMSGGRLRLQNVHPDLVEVCRITGLDRVFDLEP